VPRSACCRGTDERSSASTTRPASSTPASPAPLEAHDPDRARALKAKIRDRVSDVRRHLAALRAAMAAERVEVEVLAELHECPIGSLLSMSPGCSALP